MRRKPAQLDAGKILADKLPPHALEAEAGALACALIDPLESLNRIEETRVTQDWFYDLRHQTLLQVLLDMQESGTHIDQVTLYQWLSDRAMLSQVGGWEYVGKLPDLVPSAANLPQYLDILREKFLLRMMVRLGTDMVSSSYQIEQGQKTDPHELLARIERDILRLSEERAQVGEVRLKQIIARVIAGLEDYHRGHAQLRGVTTGIEYVDKLLCGFGGPNGNYIVLSARPSLGKTSFATQLALHAALDYAWFEPVLENGVAVMDGDKFKMKREVGIPVGIFSLEMSADALVQRMLFQRAQADMQRWRTGFAESADFPPLTKAAGELAKAPIYIDDTPRCTISSVRAKARRMWRQYGIKLFIIDYIQLMRGGRRFREDRVQELAEISGELQSLGKELNVPFIVLAQMNRDYEKDPNRQPRLSDLKDCGSIEQDADVVGFLYTPKLKTAAKETYDLAMERVFEHDWSKYPRRVNCIWAKNRYGPTGDSELLFQKSCTRFLDYNVWLKDHGYKEAALGEKQRDIIPSNEEMGYE